jgi:hypothetical protein
MWKALEAQREQLRRGNLPPGVADAAAFKRDLDNEHRAIVRRWNEVIERKKRGERTDLTRAYQLMDAAESFGKLHGFRLRFFLDEEGHNEWGIATSWRFQVMYGGDRGEFEVRRWNKFIEFLHQELRTFDFVNPSLPETEWDVDPQEIPKDYLERDLAPIEDEDDDAEGEEEDWHPPTEEEKAAAEREREEWVSDDAYERKTATWLINMEIWDGPPPAPR